MGALAASLAPQSGPLRDRLRRTAAAIGFGARRAARRPVRHRRRLGAGRGDRAALGGRGADQRGERGAVPRRAAAADLHRALLRAGHPAVRCRRRSAFFFAGAAWATLTTLVQARTEALDPDRTAVAAVFTRIADLLDRDRHRRGRGRPPRRSPPRSTPPTTGSSAAAATPPGGSGSCPSWPASSTRPRRSSRARWPPPGPACRPTRRTSPPSARWPPRSSGDRELTDERPAAAGGRPPGPARGPARRPAGVERRRRPRGAGRGRRRAGRRSTCGPGCASWPTARWPAPTAAPSPSAWRCA